MAQKEISNNLIMICNEKTMENCYNIHIIDLGLYENVIIF